MKETLAAGGPFSPLPRNLSVVNSTLQRFATEIRRLVNEVGMQNRRNHKKKQRTEDASIRIYHAAPGQQFTCPAAQGCAVCAQ